MTELIVKLIYCNYLEGCWSYHWLRLHAHVSLSSILITLHTSSTVHNVDIGHIITSLCSGWVKAQNPLGEAREKIMVWLKHTCLIVSITSAQVVMSCWLVGWIVSRIAQKPHNGYSGEGHQIHDIL